LTLKNDGIARTKINVSAAIILMMEYIEKPFELRNIYISHNEIIIFF
jgi:hypothetical protein